MRSELSGLSKMKPVCSDQWDSDWSDQTCAQLGFSGQRNTSTRYDFTLRDQEFWYRDQALPVSGSLIQKSGIPDGRCRSKETVQLECEHFGNLKLRNYLNVACRLSQSCNEESSTIFAMAN